MARLSLAPFALVGLAMFIAPLAGATARGAAIPPYSVVFSNGSTPLQTLALAPGAKVDVVWKDGACVGGYVSPPVVATWSGPTTSGGVTDATAAPIVAPCSAIKWPDDWECWIGFNPPSLDCFWTYHHTSSGSSLRAIPNPEGSENANLFLYKRTVLYALVQNPGTTTWSKVAVSPGANAARVYGAQGG